MKIKNQVQADYIRSTRDKPPETNLARAVLSRAFLDSMGYLNPQSSCGRGELSQLKNSARKFIDANKEIFREWCDIADADPDYVAELYDDLTYRLNSGKLKNLRIKVIVEKLVDRI